MVPQPGGGAERILVVEDDDPYRAYLDVRLSRAGYTVIGCPNAEVALSKLDEVDPALVITDLIMPGMDGLEFCRALRSRPGCEHLPILILSGAADSSAIGEVVGLGLIWYLRKGASWEHFRKTLQNLIARSEAVPNGA